MNKTGYIQRFLIVVAGLGMSSCTPEASFLDSSYWSTFDGTLIILIILGLIIYALINLRSEDEEHTPH